LNFRFEIWDLGFEILDLGIRNWDFRFGILESESVFGISSFGIYGFRF
jgi:hypothetical protein